MGFDDFVVLVMEEGLNVRVLNAIKKLFKASASSNEQLMVNLNGHHDPLEKSLKQAILNLDESLALNCSERHKSKHYISPK